MQPLPQDLISRLQLQKAIHMEADESRELMPTEPGWEKLVRHQKDVQTWISAQLRAGYPTSRDVVVGARKAGHGVRPVAIMHPLDRIVYRALVELITMGRATVDRSREQYEQFILAPVNYSILESRGNATRQWRTDVEYIVKTDIAAFYQYIDHEVLANELVLQAGEFEAVSALTDLLAETQGRRFGIPQQLTASHQLAECYADIIERRMIRNGSAIWRFNDDFRIAACNYPAALTAIDEISAVSREVGLTISENKTSTPTFETYLRDTTGLAISDPIPQEIEVIDSIADYFGEDVDQPDPVEAYGILDGAGITDDSPIDLRRPSSQDVRSLRRAIAALAYREDEYGLNDVVRVVSYVAALTPAVAKYLMELDNSPEVLAVLDIIIDEVSLNEWQKLWFIQAIHQLGALSPTSAGKSERRLAWARGLASSDRSYAVRAQAVAALASSARIGAEEIEMSMRDSPTCLAAWHLAALGDLAPNADARSRKIIDAAKNESKFNTWLLG
ncbi:reverse transcriptase domain-containing protein [Micromonospora globosa]|uniref:reverse transcriptase domain-containing protein n=1 Tax=Micromonospora globosa TaxID=47863 RepID=UPI000A010760|nr:reverse transcriptase domain-containing protein [Micromonospora globosa]